MNLRAEPLWPMCLAAVCLAVACHASGPERPAPSGPFPHDDANADVDATTAGPKPLAAADAGDAAAPHIVQRDPNGDDDAPVGPSAETLPKTGLTLERVGSPPLALDRICDLTTLSSPSGDALYAAHARQPLGTDGATVSRFADDKFSVAFDWNRMGEPVKGGGAGQGFLRVHFTDGRLFVPDADPPYNGLGLVEYGTEGYVFISDRTGSFARARMPKHMPPGYPSAGDDARAGAAVLPRAYHVIDTIKYRGHYYASTGSVPPKERAWAGPSPGALHVADPDLKKWSYVLGYPVPYQNGVWRLTFMVRFRDRLYAGIQDYDGVDPNSYVVFDPPASQDVLTQSDARPVRVPGLETAQTLRWYADGDTLYWLAYVRRTGQVHLMRTTDGDRWQAVPLPSDQGRATDVRRFAGRLVVLTERALLGLPSTPSTPSENTPARTAPQANDAEDDAAARAEILAEVPAMPANGARKARSPFVFDDLFCAAPLGSYRGTLYAGGQQAGALYKFVARPPQPPVAP